jgi:hypothetical protein
MRIREIAAATLCVLVAAGCATTTTASRPEVLACGSLPAAHGTGEAFDAPLSVVSAQRLYRYEGRARLRVPEGVALHVRAEHGLSTADVHRVVACRMDRGPETRIAVRPRGAGYQVIVKSRTPAIGRALQAEHAPTGG